MLSFFKAAISDVPVQWVATSDIGRFAALALADPPAYRHRIIKLAGDKTRCSEAGQDYKAINGGKALSLFWLPRRLALWMMPLDMRLMALWLVDKGYEADIDARRKELPTMLDWPAWLQQQQQARA